MRAANDDPEMGACLGINRELLMHSVVGVSAALAAISGVAAAPIFTAYATVGDKILILAFMTVILGGLGSPIGAVLAGIALGVAQEVASPFVGFTYKIAVSFLVLVVLLIVRPQGLFGSLEEVR